MIIRFTIPALIRLHLHRIFFGAITVKAFMPIAKCTLYAIAHQTLFTLRSITGGAHDISTFNLSLTSVAQLANTLLANLDLTLMLVGDHQTIVACCLGTGFTANEGLFWHKAKRFRLWGQWLGTRLLASLAESLHAVLALGKDAGLAFGFISG